MTIKLWGDLLPEGIYRCPKHGIEEPSEGRCPVCGRRMYEVDGDGYPIDIRGLGVQINSMQQDQEMMYKKLHARLSKIDTTLTKVKGTIKGLITSIRRYV